MSKPPERMDTSSSRSKLIVYFIGGTAALAGLLFGLDIGVISGAQLFIQRDFGVTDRVIEWIVSAVLWGAVFGALLSGFLSNRLGRRRTILCSALAFVLGSLLCAMAPTAEFLMGARFVLGLAMGMASFTAPLYLAEISPQSVRGGMISMYQLMITIGIVVAFLSDTYFASLAEVVAPASRLTQGDADATYLHSFVLSVAHGSGAWRMMLGVIAIPALIMFAGVFLLPESPRWLFLNGFREQAAAVFKRLHLDDAEIQEIEKSSRTPQKGFQLFRENGNFRRAVWLGVGLQCIQQLTGINVIMYYAPRIFGMAGFSSTTQQMWGTVIIGVINVLATFIAIAFVDRIGRKPMMYAGFVVMGAALLCVGVLFNIGVEANRNLAYCSMLALAVFIIGFAMSAGPIIWVLCSEIYPLTGRDFGIMCSTATNWIANAIVGMTFLSLVGQIGPGATFLLYGGLNVLFILFFLAFVPETRGISLERIEASLLAGNRLRAIGR